MRPRHVLPLLALAVSVLAGCGEEAPRPQVIVADRSPGSGAAVRPAPEDEAELWLYVSNQSFADDPVRLGITIDGVPVVDQDFTVGSQHTWVQFPLTLSPGRHELVAASGTGAEVTETFRTSEQTRYAVISYWNDEDDGRYLDWRIQDDPVAFD